MASPDMDLEDYSIDSPSEVPSTPHTFVDSDSPPQKKKRKAWGQPIPEFEKLIGPRKRAKTEAEKTQRAHERTLRNRRAAAQSRDKKQAQFAAMEEEMQKLRDELALYQARFGSINQASINTPASDDDSTPTLTFHSYSAPLSEPCLQAERLSDSPSEKPLSISTPGPALSQETSLLSQIQPSPTLAPTLQLDADAFPSHMSFTDEPTLTLASDLPDATQYSAAVLSDPQCLSSAKSSSQSQSTASTLSLQLLLHLVNLTTLMTTNEAFSSSMTSPLNQILRILAGDWGMPWSRWNGLDRHFQLIYCLITTPMKGTTRPVFRTKLLSRFLACNPITARLITVAADRALQLQASEEMSLDDPEGCQRWASLMTFRWTIQWLEKEHDKVRGACREKALTGPLTNQSLEQGFGNQRVAYRAVERSAWRWDNWEWEHVDVI